ncbi:hypothetical protein HK097_006752 [Rhizophlyctis rosea]|uniref:Uncharacterized protein n=1 Tax=Rhizophlyctis rosea TaxID=64517 RepID=A0AAD5X2P1_9FUNG|nr:hypothetical protein HK097_006752 [Rhizophlyctis rosea]
MADVGPVQLRNLSIKLACLSIDYFSKQPHLACFAVTSDRPYEEFHQTIRLTRNNHERRLAGQRPEYTTRIEWPVVAPGPGDMSWALIFYALQTENSQWKAWERELLRNGYCIVKLRNTMPAPLGRAAAYQNIRTEFELLTKQGYVEGLTAVKDADLDPEREDALQTMLESRIVVQLLSNCIVLQKQNKWSTADYRQQVRIIVATRTWRRVPDDKITLLNDYEVEVQLPSHAVADAIMQKCQNRDLIINGIFIRGHWSSIYKNFQTTAGGVIPMTYRNFTQPHKTDIAALYLRKGAGLVELDGTPVEEAIFRGYKPKVHIPALELPLLPNPPPLPNFDNIGPIPANPHNFRKMNAVLDGFRVLSFIRPPAGKGYGMFINDLLDQLHENEASCHGWSDEKTRKRKSHWLLSLREEALYYEIEKREGLGCGWFGLAITANRSNCIKRAQQILRDISMKRDIILFLEELARSDSGHFRLNRFAPILRLFWD